jgi:hypothetical protein
MVGLLLALTVVGLGVVVIRVDEAAISQRIQELQFRQTELRRQLWTQEMELARLRSPGMIRERAERFGQETGFGLSETENKSRPTGSAGVRKGTRVVRSGAPAAVRGDGD